MDHKMYIFLLYYTAVLMFTLYYDNNQLVYPVVLFSAETQDEIKEKAAFEDLEQSFKTLTSRKIKDKLSAFLPDIPGMNIAMVATTCHQCHGNVCAGDLDATSMGHNTYVFEHIVVFIVVLYSLKAVIDRPPIEDREFAPLSELQGFKLLPGAVSYLIKLHLNPVVLLSYLKHGHHH